MPPRSSRRVRRSPARKSAAVIEHGDWIRLAFLAALMVVAIAAVYGSVAHHDFVNFDDGALVAQNPHVTSGLTLENIRWAFANPYVGSGGPLTWMSHMLDVELFGVAPGPHHVVNVILHACNAVLLMMVLWRMTGAVGRSGCVAALFALHPLNVEPVAWIAQRKDMLSTMFLLLTIATYVGYVRRPSMSRYAAVFLLVTVGLLAKPMLVTVPAVLLLLDVWPLDRMTLIPIHRLILEKLPLLLPVFAAAVMTIVDQRTIGALSLLEALPLSKRLANGTVSYVAYLGKLIWPANLSLFYPYREHVSAITLALCAASLLVVSIAVVRSARRFPYLSSGWGWYVITLIPVIGIVQAGGHAMADRFSYVPTIGIFIAVVWALAAVVERLAVDRRMVAAATVVVLLGYGVVSHAQVSHWQDSITVWTHTITVTDNNSLAHANLGEVLASRGMTDRAIEEYWTALRISPGIAQTQNNLALALRRQGRNDEALSHFLIAIDIRPDYAQAHNNLANLLSDLGRVEDALPHWREAIRLSPQLIEARVNLGMALAQAGDAQAGIAQLQEASRLQPGRSEWHDVLATMYLDSGRRDDAVTELQTALRVNPDDSTAKRILADIGR